MTEPIKPNEVKPIIPNEVIEVFNSLIKESWDGIYARVLQWRAVKLIAQKMSITKKDVLAEGYLNIEEIYRAVGWQVNYNNEYYSFEFSKKD